MEQMARSGSDNDRMCIRSKIINEMKKVFKIFFLLIMMVSPMTLQSSTLTIQQKEEAIKKINAAASGLKSMSCGFTQTKHLSLLSDKMQSEGKMYFKNPDKLRWEYVTPYSYMFIFNGSKVYVGGKTRKDVIDTNTNKIFKEVARIMMSTVTGKALSNSADFAIDVESIGNFWVVNLIPKKRDMKQMFRKIELTFTKSNTMISEINMYEKNGDKTNIKLKNIVTNSAINETLFAIPK